MDDGSQTPAEGIGEYERSIHEMRRAERVAQEQRLAAARRRRTIALAVIPLLAVVALSVWVLGRGSGGGTAGQGVAGADCEEPTAVRVWSTPVAAAAVTAAAADYSRSSLADPCISFEVTSHTPMDATLAIAAGQPGGPQAWVVDSPMWVERVAGTAEVAATPNAPFARSPLVLATTATTATSLTRADWASLALETQGFRVSDARTTTEGMLALATALPSLTANVKGTEAIKRLATTAASGTDVLFEQLHSGGAAGTSLVFPATEASILATNAVAGGEPGATGTSGAPTGTGIVQVAPAGGSPVLEYSLVTLGSEPAVSRAVSGLSAYLGSASAQPALLRAGLRPASGATAAPSGAPGQVSMLQPPSTEALVAATDAWQSALVTFSMLAVVDVSDSMSTTSGGSSRIALTQQAARVALGALPSSTEVGVWAAARDIGGPARPFVELAPIEALGAEGQAMRLGVAAEAVGNRVGGKDDLYAAIWAAYENVLSHYDAGKVNAVVVITDGQRDTANTTMSLEQLLSRLKAADPAKPIAVTTIGIGPDVDAASLDQVSRAAHSRYFGSTDPADITSLIGQALFEHTCLNGVCA